MSVEIIQFFRPEGGKKNLFISNIAGNVTEDVVHETLYGDFSRFGLLYEIQVFPLNSSVKCEVWDGRQSENDHAASLVKEQTPVGWYAFVKFYSCMAACKAKVFLDGHLSMGQPYKIAFATRRTLQDDKPPVLYFRKCQQLANYYLGFNGWSVAIKCLEEDGGKDESPGKLRYVCSVRLILTNQGFQSDGVGVWEENVQTNNPDPMSKGPLIGQVKKLAYQMALQNAFSKVVLIVLSNGKVNVEINTTKVDTLLKNAHIDEAGLIKVNELDTKPGETEMETAAQVRADAEFPQLTDSFLDDVNVHLLQELEDN